MRLIDADALIEDIKPFWDWDSIDGITATTVLKQTITDISHAPTIDAVPHWIPCEERLPEIGEGFCSKDVIVALDDGGIAFTCLEATLFGSVCWQIERMNEIEDGKEINVIAWMPLPEPYEGERSK